MTVNLNVQLSVIRRGPLDVTAYATRTTVVGHQGVTFWLDGPDLKRIGSEGYEVTWDMNDYNDLVVFPTLETIWPTEYAKALRAMGGITMGRYRGTVCGHCFGGPAGTYQVACTIRNRVGVVQTILAATITKQDPDTVYSGTNTICYSTSGNFTGAPSGSEQITVADGVVTRALFTSANKRILFRSGETFTQDIACRDADQMYVSTFGGSTPATLTKGFLLNSGAGPHENMVFDNIKLDLGYDPTAANDWWNEGTAPTRPEKGFEFTSGTVTGMTLHQVYATGVDMGIYIIGTGHVYFDCGVTDYFDFGIFDLNDKGALVGSFSAQNPSAPNVNLTAGGAGLPSNRAAWNTTIQGTVATALAAHAYFGPLGQVPNWPRHAPLRNTAPANGHCVVRSALISSAPGWSGHPQPAARWIREENIGAGVAAHANMTDSYLRGGVQPLAVSAFDVPSTVAPKLILVDGNILEAAEGTWSFIAAFVGNTWIRNCLLLMPSTVTLDTPQPNLRITEAGGTMAAVGDGFFIDNCTIVLQGDLDGKTFGFDTSANSQPIVFRNNLHISTATNIGSISVPSGTITATSLTGYNADFSPETGNSTVVGQVAGVAPVVDLDGNMRGTPGTIGALEPS